MDKLILRLLLAAFFWCLAGLAHAQTQTVTRTLNWTDNSTDEDGFRVYQCVGTGCTPTNRIGTVNANVTSFVDTINNDPGNRTICYRVTAFNVYGESVPTNTACFTTPVIAPIPPPTPPNAPTGLTITQLSQGSIHLRWADLANETKYEVSRNSVIVGETSQNVAAYADAGLSRDTAYTYRVRGVNQVGAGAWSTSRATRTRK